jgi:hypothetical protein
VKQRLFIVSGLILLILVLIGLNAASFSRQNKMPDNEFYPNRSTYNSDSTGTRAVYELLSETGRKVVRWQEKPSLLLSNTSNRPSVFVIVGKTRKTITETDAVSIMRWVSEGGRLVIVDREPLEKLVKTDANWAVAFNLSENVEVAVVTDPNQLTAKSDALKPLQPTPYTRGINSIKPSVLASSISLKYLPANLNSLPITDEKSRADEAESSEEYLDKPILTIQAEKQTPTPTSKSESQIETEKEGVGDPFLNAPVIHFAKDDKAILADFPFGAGEVVFLSDPFIIANNGLSLADNAQLAINLFSTQNGITAFDEFHQGYGKSEDRLAAYFEGTPVAAILAQIGLFFGLFFWSQGRRFARALPNGELDRLSKLEYVGAMAEIQQNIKAYDLAIENIFKEFRRNLVRFAGTDNTVSNSDLAKLVGLKADIESPNLLSLMSDCESIHQGEPTNKSEVLKLTKQIREYEQVIGITRVARRKM